ncbi:NUDIX hydrolase [Crocosphaera chwakensis]|uniref:NUDIX hydrolase n=1 Tax=Crocosphaera chwakensis CCY0110 TaxID=391612 RepID=A3IRK6_9CHRO|nr:NUDIX hydrolase [Crocosphaera chwakensis]EAZ90855.1 NUDIX hydrolase [Crocosphaera chwakensis CCY0110]
MTLQKWKILKSDLIIDNQWCRVRQDQVKLSDGTIIDDYFVNIRPEIALILPITPNKEIVFVRQYRHGVQEILLELPAGTFDPKKEDSLTAAKRELEEETGYIAQELLFLKTIYDNPVKDDNKIHIFLGLNVEKTGKIDLDVTEEIEVVLVPMTDVIDKIMSGEICVAGTISTIFMGLEFISEQQSVNSYFL